MGIILKALDFATKAHEGQKRKYTGEDYICHPISVANTVSKYIPNNPIAHVIALLHDTVEDTDITLQDIYNEFGYKVMKGVYYLTDCDKSTGNRKTRKMIDNIRLSSAPPIIQSIKYADLIDNTPSIAKHDPKFAKLYLQEKRELLEVMNCGNIDLYNKALEYCNG